MKKDIVAMILAGGKGTRLSELTNKLAKPAVFFGGKYRLIDFPLSVCTNSGIDSVGVVTQYESNVLARYIGNGEKWGLNGVRSVTATLTPIQTESGIKWFKGTADAIYQNLQFLDHLDPEYVLILSGDHVFVGDFQDMIRQHKANKAACTIASIHVNQEETSRFGILKTDTTGRVVEFVEKPKETTSRLASMGVYIFSYRLLKRMLVLDSEDGKSHHDFGKDIIPKYIADNRRVFSYLYTGYWRDVGTISALHQANMDLLSKDEKHGLHEIFKGLNVYSEDTYSTPQYIGNDAIVKNSIINQGAVVLGSVIHSVIFNEVKVESDAEVKDCVIFPGAIIKSGAKVYNCVIPGGVVVSENLIINKKTEKVILLTKKEVTRYESTRDL